MVEAVAVMETKRFIFKIHEFTSNYSNNCQLQYVYPILTNTGLHRLEMQVPHLQDRVPVEILFYHHQEELLREWGRLVIWI